MTVKWQVINGDALECLRGLEAESCHALVTDPPAGISFMSKGWDSDKGGRDQWIAWLAGVMREALRVLKPGAHALVWAIPRTSHWTATAIEDAGFEIRDVVAHHFGCLSEDTEILIDGQWEPYHKAVTGCLALCYDVEHDTLTWSPIQDLFVYDHCGIAYRIVSDCTDQIVTREHRCLVERGGAFVFEQAEKAARERQAYIPVVESLSDLLCDLPVPEQVAGIGAPREPRSDRQQDWESVALREQSGSQTIRASRYTRSDLARIGPVEYQGKVWCVKVPTSAFVARRNGKVFVTGNSGFPKNLDVSKAIDKVRNDEAEIRIVCRAVRAAIDASDETAASIAKQFGFHQRMIDHWAARDTDSQPLLPTSEQWQILCKLLPLGDELDWLVGTLNKRKGEAGDAWKEARVIGEYESATPGLGGERFSKRDATIREATDAAKRWGGWGTALKPSTEHWILARKSATVDECKEIALSADANTRPTQTGSKEDAGSPVHMNVEIDCAEIALAIKTLTGKVDGGSGLMDTLRSMLEAANADLNTNSSRKKCLEGDFDETRTSTTSTKTNQTTGQKISACSQLENTQGSISKVSPGSAHIILARKPLGSTVAACVLEHGTGGLNIDGARIPAETQTGWGDGGSKLHDGGLPRDGGDPRPVNGRWPPNLLLSHSARCEGAECVACCPVFQIGEQSGESASGQPRSDCGRGGIWSPSTGTPAGQQHGDTGTAARFFPTFHYEPKPSALEREQGVEHLDKRTAGELTDRKDSTNGLKSPRAGAGRTSKGRANIHPTVKSIALMQWLCRLITPPNGVVLDCFCGSGSTGIAALREDLSFIGIELDPDYAEIARNRIVGDAPLLNVGREAPVS